MDLKQYKYEDATHKLMCSHQYNRYSRVEYSMHCLILKEMLGNRAKIIVFGDHRLKWENCNGKRTIRYVEGNRIKPLQSLR